MDFRFVYDFAQKIMQYVKKVGEVLSTTLGDMVGNLGVPEEWIGTWSTVTLLDFMLVGGISFIIGYTLAKWVIDILP